MLPHSHQPLTWQLTPGLDPAPPSLEGALVLCRSRSRGVEKGGDRNFHASFAAVPAETWLGLSQRGWTSRINC
jgi:hypothetical protein